jgi:hypothetical protein
MINENIKVRIDELATHEDLYPLCAVVNTLIYIPAAQEEYQYAQSIFDEEITRLHYGRTKLDTEVEL